jgi:hypothetical protein
MRADTHGGHMSRLRRFDEHRFVGARDTMVVYDCDDPDELRRLEARVVQDDLFTRNLLQTFAPDELPEARNRGFTPKR